MAIPRGANCPSVTVHWEVLLYRLVILFVQLIVHMRLCDWSAQGSSLPHLTMIKLWRDLKVPIKQKWVYTDTWWPLLRVTQSGSSIVWHSRSTSFKMGWNYCMYTYSYGEEMQLSLSRLTWKSMIEMIHDRQHQTKAGYCFNWLQNHNNNVSLETNR